MKDNKIRKMYRRIKIALFFLIAGVCAVSAQTPLKMAFQTLDGQVSTIDASSLSISVKGDKLIASNNATSLELDLQKLVKMYFTGYSNSVELVSVTLDDGDVAVYSLEGKFIGGFASSKQAISSLSAGVYIVKTTDKRSFKIAVQ